MKPDKSKLKYQQCKKVIRMARKRTPKYLLILLSSLFLPALPVMADQNKKTSTPVAGASKLINGSIEHTDEMPMEKITPLVHQFPQVDTSSNAPKPKIPDWVPNYARASVYTNQTMTMKVFKRMALPGGSKKIKAEIPDKGATIRIKKTVLDNWKGKFPNLPCMVVCEPFGPEGNFKFHNEDPLGPRGYLERIGRDEEGFVNYRYWFAPPAQTVSESKPAKVN